MACWNVGREDVKQGSTQEREPHVGKVRCTRMVLPLTLNLVTSMCAGSRKNTDFVYIRSTGAFGAHGKSQNPEGQEVQYAPRQNCLREPEPREKMQQGIHHVGRKGEPGAIVRCLAYRSALPNYADPRLTTKCPRSRRRPATP